MKRRSLIVASHSVSALSVSAKPMVQNLLIHNRGNFIIISLYIKVGCSLKCSLHWEHLEKWLIQFWNPILMAGNIGYMPFPNFSGEGIITNIVAFQPCSLYWSHLEK